MKFARCLLALTLVGIPLTQGLLRGDNTERDTDNSSMWIDPDAPPKDFEAPVKKPASSHQRSAQKEMEEKQQEKRDWLLHGYDEQLRSQTKGDGASQVSEAYLSETAEMERQAGLPPNDTADTPGTKDLHLSPDNSSKESIGLRTDGPAGPPQAGANKSFQPLITGGGPSVPPPFFPTSTFFAPPVGSILSFNSPPGSSSQGPTTPAPRRSLAETGSGDMDIPGSTAADSDPAAQDSADLKDTDLLPGELTAGANTKPHEPLELKLPLMRDSERLAKMQDDALRVPGVPDKKPLVLPVVQPAKPPTESDNVVHIQGPSRVHIADPYDILQ